MDQIPPFEHLLERANFFLDSIGIDFADPRTKEFDYFKPKKPIIIKPPIKNRPKQKAFDLLLEKANAFLESIGVDFGDPQTSESGYFQTKKKSLFQIPIDQATSALFQQSSTGTPKSTSELLKNRPKMKHLPLPLIKPSGFSSPQPLKRQTVRRKPSIEDFSDELQSGSLASLDLSEDDEKATQPSLTLDHHPKDSNRKRLSLFSTLLMRDTLEDLDSGKTDNV